jgi:hypothetical protein
MIGNMLVSHIKECLCIEKKLYANNYNEQQILDLFSFIDWLIALPKQLRVCAQMT